MGGIRFFGDDAGAFSLLKFRLSMQRRQLRFRRRAVLCRQLRVFDLLLQPLDFVSRIAFHEREGAQGLARAFELGCRRLRALFLQLEPPEDNLDARISAGESLQRGA
jgi:hypothetical protein